MTWYDELYVGESIVHKTKRVKWKINHNAGQIGIYVIAPASNDKRKILRLPDLPGVMMRHWKWQCRLWMKYTGIQARFWCAAIWMSIGAAGRDNGSSIADIKNNWNHPADPAWTDPAHSGSGAICSGAVSGEWQHRGEDDRPDCGDVAFACGKLEGGV